MQKPRINQKNLEAFRKTLPEYRRRELFMAPCETFDIVKAQYLISKYPRQVQEIETQVLALLCGYDQTPTSDDEGYYHFPSATGEGHIIIQEHDALHHSCVDVTRPIIIVPSRFYKGQIIDGLHRLYKAYCTGITTIHAYVLTSEEAKLL